MRKFYYLLLLVALAGLYAPAWAQTNLVWTQKSATLPDGVTLYETSSTLYGRAFYAVYAKTDLRNPNLELKVVNTAAQTLEAHSDAVLNQVYVCTNGGYFGGGVSYSLAVDNGKLLAPNIRAVTRTSEVDGKSYSYYPTRGAFGTDKAGTMDIGWVYTPAGDTYLYPAPAPNTLSELPKAQPDASYPTGGTVWQPDAAIGGGPVLLADGTIRIDGTNPELFPDDIMTGLAPRTAIGYTADGYLIQLVCDGRQTHSQGASLAELAEIMKELGCVEAMNLDGGGSSAMMAGGELQNKPSDGTVRAVPTAVMVVSKEFANKKTLKREFRAPWICSVSNLDWPKSGDKGNAAAQKADLIQMLDYFASMNFNAVQLQVRPECDALYASRYEPWSRYLGGAQGTYPGYDPLAFAVEEAHKRGLELHAWLNPYRINASTADGGSYYHETHVYKEHPDWALVYSDGKKILNPGLPQVSDYIADVVRDLVSHYDVDGIHFDDYF